ncbi:BURP domain-containing protein 6-like isoform X1 [Nicotiana tomentosiformis]|uniref:BURP domain-containing protein 6-like isoform X1 n=1 Tax=Nicotiana tomentosiformis TaxID=4098 RepID=UPI00051B6311|nr:BURP domain-containing protein 3-like isoform X1 [Nicotiana tomentosiformis]XP_016468555.1 PREDICTED: BURP domain-containing protein 3-like [Nicotiana tabacum]
MKLQLLYSLIIFCLAFVTSTYAVISPEIYWKVKLPNTQIPKVIKDFLSQSEGDIRELKQDKTNTKEKVYYGLHQHGILVYHVATEDEIRDIKKEIPSMNHATIKSDVQDDFLYKPYFLENDLAKRKVINFPSFKNKNEAPFLSRQFVESIPFSLKKIPEILNHFSIDSSSKNAQTIEETIKFCEELEVKHKEKKSCATSLESMVDFSLSMLGTNNILAITTEVQGETPMLQKYTIEEVQQIGDGDNMVCHKLNYAYAVHFCHVGGRTKTFSVSMIGADGTKVKAISVCHKDTSLWNPRGLPFVVLKVKPGTTPICHFLQDDQIVFIPSKEATNYAIS